MCFFDFTGIEQSETVAFFDAKHFQRIQACQRGFIKLCNAFNVEEIVEKLYQSMGCDLSKNCIII